MLPLGGKWVVGSPLLWIVVFSVYLVQGGRAPVAT
jgi:hypothetical protein